MRPLQVNADQIGGARPVALLDGGGELPVLGDELRKGAGITGDGTGGDALLAIAQCVVLAVEHLVSVGSHDHAVERPIGDGERIAAPVERSFLVGHQLSERRGQSASTLGDADDAVALDQQPRLEHVVGL